MCVFETENQTADANDDIQAQHDEIQAQYNHLINTIITWGSLSTLSNESTRVGDQQSISMTCDDTMTPIPLASLSPHMNVRSVSFGSSDNEGSPSPTATGLGISSV